MKISRSAIIYLLAAILLMFAIVAAFTFSALTKDQNLRADLLRNGERTSGKIIDIRGARRRARFIDMEFTTSDGRIVKATYRNRMNMPERSRLIEGMSVDVVFDPADPSRAIPAPYQNVPQRKVVSELIALLRKIGLTVLMVSPLIVGISLLRHRLQSRRTTRLKSD